MVCSGCACLEEKTPPAYWRLLTVSERGSPKKSGELAVDVGADDASLLDVGVCRGPCAFGGKLNISRASLGDGEVRVTLPSLLTVIV